MLSHDGPDFWVRFFLRNGLRMQLRAIPATFAAKIRSDRQKLPALEKGELSFLPVVALSYCYCYVFSFGMAVEYPPWTVFTLPQAIDETTMTPASMPMPEVQLLKQQKVASNQQAKQGQPDKNFLEMLDKASAKARPGTNNPTKMTDDPKTSKTASPQENVDRSSDTKKTDSSQENQSPEALEEKTAPGETTAAKGAETTEKTTGVSKAEEARMAEDVAESDAMAEAEEAALTDEAAKAEKSAKTAKRRRGDRSDEADAAIAQWPVPIGTTPIVTSLHPHLTLQNNAPAPEQIPGIGEAESGSGAARGAWPLHPPEGNVAGFKPPLATGGRAGGESTPTIAGLGLHNQRPSGTGQVIQHAAKSPLPAHSPNFGEDLAERVGSIRLISRPGMSEQVRLSLVPRDLGTLDVRLQVDDDNRVHMLITAESDAAKDLLNKQMPQLRESLARQNFNLGDLFVQVDQRQKGDRSDQGFEWRESRRGSASTEVKQTDTGGRPIPNVNRPWTKTDGLSVFA